MRCAFAAIRALARSSSANCRARIPPRLLLTSSTIAVVAAASACTAFPATTYSPSVWPSSRQPSSQASWAASRSISVSCQGASRSPRNVGSATNWRSNRYSAGLTGPCHSRVKPLTQLRSSMSSARTRTCTRPRCDSSSSTPVETPASRQRTGTRHACYCSSRSVPSRPMTRSPPSCAFRNVASCADMAAGRETPHLASAGANGLRRW